MARQVPLVPPAWFATDTQLCQPAQHPPDGFHGQRKLIKIRIQAVAEATQVAGNEELCWSVIAAATAWLPKPEPTDAPSP